MKTNFIIILFGLLNIFSAFGQSITKESWIEDINYLKTELPKKHKNLFFQLDSSVFYNNLDTLIKKINQFDDFEIIIRLQQIITKVGDSHTNIDYYGTSKKKGQIPIGVMWFKDGYYPFLIPEKRQDLKGKKLIAINQYSINEVADSLSTLIGSINESLLKKQFPNYVTHIGLLEYFKFSKNDTIQLIFQGENGEKSSLIYSKDLRNNFLKYGMPKMIQTNTNPLYWSNMGKIFWMEEIKSHNALYVGYNKCYGKKVAILYGMKNVENIPSFEEFTQRVFNSLDSTKFDKLIFDLRLNTGGLSGQGTEFIEKLAKNDYINTKGRLFVIIGRDTYSSGLINALDFKNNTNAILVGESTSGKPNHYGDVKQLKLPTSGINVNYSSAYFEYLKDDPNSLYPDIYVEPTYSDFENGVDPVLKKILDYKN